MNARIRGGFDDLSGDSGTVACRFGQVLIAGELAIRIQGPGGLEAKQKPASGEAILINKVVITFVKFD